MTRYGTPADVAFCTRCVMSNQRPSSTVERRNTGGPKTTLGFNADGVCAACEYQEHIDHRIDWAARDAELRRLCDQHRSADGSPDCIVPGSGGKDSWFAACKLAEDYGMHPLTVTWAPMMWTDVGRRNYDRWSGRFPHVLMKRDEDTHRLLTRLAFLNLCNPFQPFVIGQRQCGARVSVETGVPLVFYGENPAQYAGPVERNYESRMEPEFYRDEACEPIALCIGGLDGNELMRDHGLRERNLEPYCPVSRDAVASTGTDFRYLGYFLRWDPQEVYYYAQARGFECNDRRTEGTFAKYASIDDKMDTLHYFSTLQKFGIGRCMYDAAQEVRWGKITREEAVALVRKYDGEFPTRDLVDCCMYMGVHLATVLIVLGEARAPHLWKYERNTWQLRAPVWEAR